MGRLAWADAVAVTGAQCLKSLATSRTSGWSLPVRASAAWRHSGNDMAADAAQTERGCYRSVSERITSPGWDPLVRGSRCGQAGSEDQAFFGL